MSPETTDGLLVILIGLGVLVLSVAALMAILTSDSQPIDQGALGNPECIRRAALEEAVAALEIAYHPQNPTHMHPADYVTLRFKLDGHEGLREEAQLPAEGER